MLACFKLGLLNLVFESFSEIGCNKTCFFSEKFKLIKKVYERYKFEKKILQLTKVNFTTLENILIAALKSFKKHNYGKTVCFSMAIKNYS